MPMQQDADTVDYPTVVRGSANPCVPPPTGPGGSLIQVNQNEAEILEASYEDARIDQVGFADSFGSVQGIFQMPGL